MTHIYTLAHGAANRLAGAEYDETGLNSGVYAAGPLARASRRGGNGTGARQAGAMSLGVNVP
jgi:hypothetical protein